MNTTPPLPDHATSASRYRLQVALLLTRACPPALASEIALTGSSARGHADDDSDLEVNLWADALPAADARAEWLYAQGVRDLVVHLRPRPDGSHWISGLLHDLPLEAGWQTFADLDASLAPAADGQAEPASLMLAELIASSVALKDGPHLAGWRQRLAQYPRGLRAARIDALLRRLADDDHWRGLERLAARGERLAAVSLLRDDLQLMMSALYALNGRWEAGAKWTLTLAGDLPLMPQNWRERLEEAVATPDEAGVALCRALMADAAALAGGD